MRQPNTGLWAYGTGAGTALTYGYASATAALAALEAAVSTVPSKHRAVSRLTSVPPSENGGIIPSEDDGEEEEAVARTAVGGEDAQSTQGTEVKSWLAAPLNLSRWRPPAADVAAFKRKAMGDQPLSIPRLPLKKVRQG
jgi:hypothetical protein